MYRNGGTFAWLGIGVTPAGIMLDPLPIRPAAEPLDRPNHSAAYRPQPKAAIPRWSGFDLESRDLQPDDQVNHRDDQPGGQP